LAGVEDDGTQDQPSSEEGPGESAPLNIRPLRAVLLILLLLAGYLAATFVDIWFATRRSADGEASAALVLGAAQYNGTPSPVLVRRLDEAANLYESGRVELVVVTGGQQEGDVTTEAKAGYDYLRSLGIPDSDLRLEVQGDSTYTSMAAAARFLRNEEVNDVILVTDAYHTRRVELIADEVGLVAEVSAVGDADFNELIRETAAVSVGRVVGFRRLDRLRGS
jgi:vancomycin permeability regulator SanA